MSEPLLPEPDLLPALFPTDIPLHGQDVTLARLSPSHTSALYTAIGTDASLWSLVPSGPFDTPAAFAAYLAQYHDTTTATHAFYAVIPHAANLAAGIIGLWAPSLPHRTTEIGPVIYGPALQRTAAGTEAVYLLGRCVFEDLRFRRWEWRLNSSNGASRRAAERYGFTYEGTLRKHMIVKGRSRDTSVYAMLEEEWPERKTVFEAWLAEGNFDVEGAQRKGMGEVRKSLVKGDELK